MKYFLLLISIIFIGCTIYNYFGNIERKDIQEDLMEIEQVKEILSISASSLSVDQILIKTYTNKNIVVKEESISTGDYICRWTRNGFIWDWNLCYQSEIKKAFGGKE